MTDGSPREKKGLLHECMYNAIKQKWMLSTDRKGVIEGGVEMK